MISKFGRKTLCVFKRRFAGLRAGVVRIYHPSPLTREKCIGARGMALVELPCGSAREALSYKQFPVNLNVTHCRVSCYLVLLTDSDYVALHINFNP